MNNSTPHHSFDILLATELGDVNLAILIHNFQFWIMLNKRQGINQHDGRTWTYQTIKQIASCFPYWSIKQVERLLAKAVELKILRKGNYNKMKFDHTLWYCFENEEMFTISRFREIEVLKSGKGSPEIGKPIPDTESNTELRYKEGPSAPTLSASVNKKEKSEIKKIAFGTYVKFKEGEYETLCSDLGMGVVEQYIMKINLYIPNRTKGEYKDYAAAIRTWYKNDLEKGSLPVNDKSKAVPKDVPAIIDENKAISFGIWTIVMPLFNENRKFIIDTHLCQLFFDGMQNSIIYRFSGTADVVFKKDIFRDVAKVFPEVKEKIKELFKKYN